MNSSDSLGTSATVLDESELELQDANWDTDRFLRFVDPRVERLYCRELFLRRRRLGYVMCSFWACVVLLEFFSVAGWEYLQDHDFSAKLAGGLRIVVFFILFCGAAALKANVLDVERIGCSSLFVLPVAFFLGDTYRTSALFGSDFTYRRFEHCGAETCWSDAQLLLQLVILNCTPLLLSIRISRAWVGMSWAAMLYLPFSLGGLSPMQSTATLICTLMLFGICAFLLIAVYRLESESRRKWLDNLRLRLEVALQKSELQDQRQWLRKVEERLEALGGSGIAPDLPPSHAAARAVALGTASASQSDGSAAASPTVVPRPPVSASEDEGGVGIEASPSKPAPLQEPNSVLATAMVGHSLDVDRLHKMAKRISDVSYGMREFFEDCMFTFPELGLFFVLDEQATSSGNSAATEFQRTVGALFAVYWLLRMDTDGKQGFCFGCDEDWNIQTNATGKPSDARKRAKFYDDFQWSFMEEVVHSALQLSPSERPADRVEALLCLTAFHDIMKVQALCPRVSLAHAPYEGYGAGEQIHDHDLALAYVLEHYPELLPSFRALPQASREVILFTQGKMHFNHGWFVQAEAPPGAMLSKLKRVLHKAAPADLAFYFCHWLTDLSGAEGQPLAGAEKFVLRFPRSVLSSFLWSIPYLQHLTTHSETSVVEGYLEARFQLAMPGDECPQGRDAIALMRLVVMAQGVGDLVPEAFQRLPPNVRGVLASELARTGIEGQSYERTPEDGGPALFVYYGPALLQHCTSLKGMSAALRTLAAVYHAARVLWPLCFDQGAFHAVTLDAAALKANAGALVAGRGGGDGSIMVLEKRSGVEGIVRLVTVSGLNELVQTGSAFWALDPEGTLSSTAGVGEFSALV